MNKKELNKFPLVSDRKFTLPKSQILRGRRNFEQLFSNKSTLITAPSVNLRFIVHDHPASKNLVGFISPAKIGNAVKRMRAKRLLREAYRLNQHLLTNRINASQKNLHVAFIAKRALNDFNATEADVKLLLSRLTEKLNRISF